MLLEEALLSWDKIDDVLLVGGSTRMPCVSAMLEDISGKLPNMAVAPDQIVAHGAAIHAAIISLSESGALRTAAENEGKSDDLTWPDPAADQAEETERMKAVFSEPVVEAARSVMLGDVNSHGLGVIVRSSRENRTVNSLMIPKNTPLPTTRVKVFGTEARNQRMVRLRIVEGDSRDPRGCTQIGECVIKHLPKGLPKGNPVEVTFAYDTSGRIHVRAVEMTSNISADVELQRDTGFAQRELEMLTNTVAELDVQ
jgi:molecular chaperone DnaK